MSADRVSQEDIEGRRDTTIPGRFFATVRSRLGARDAGWDCSSVRIILANIWTTAVDLMQGPHGSFNGG